ncbi:MAG: hypothetical protein IJG87_03255 [Ruminococcus sp.]|nr:hypothetical protein [Ruminococcus sp.]
MKTTEDRITQLRRAAEQTKEMIRVNDYDFENGASAKDFEKYTEMLYKNRVGMIRSYGQQNKTVDLSEMNYDILSRRSAAVNRLAPQADRQYKEKYPAFCVAEIFAQLCAPCPTDTFNGLDGTYHIETAAAIWILDHLRNSGRLDDALEFLPESREELDKIDLPDVTDSVHCDDLIRGMLYVIRCRNGSKSGFDASKAFMDSADANIGTSDKTDDDSGRARFEGVTALLDADTVEELCSRFTAYVRELTESCLAIYAQLHEKVVTLAGHKLDMIEKEIAGSQAAEGSLSVLNQPDDGSETTVTAASDMREDTFETEDELQKAIFREESFYMNVMLLCAAHRRQMRDVLGDETVDRLYRPVIGDPFGMCFAFLSLLDSDSDIIWLYNLPYIILADACLELPWAGAEQINASGEQPKPSSAFCEAAKDPERYITDPSESILNQKIVLPPFAGTAEDTISFAQLVYLFSGLTPPRGMPELSYVKALFAKSDLSEAEIDILYEYFTLACSLSRRDENYVFIDEDDEDNGEGAEESASNESMRELRELKRENKNLKAMLNKLERRLRESAEALSSMSDSLDEANAELGELRSMIREADISEKEYSVTVTFPYTAKKRAVVFGGHSSWLKAIRPLLPNVRFVEPSAQPNTGLILNADVIWIQTNAMSHSDFYKIIDVVRKNNIELHYFKYASAEKCAEQFALEDMGAEEE